MLKLTKTQVMVSFIALLFTFLFIGSVFVDYSEARSRSGGRSFSRSTTYKQSPRRTTSVRPKQSSNRTGIGNSSFLKGLGGGILGGFIGNMLFRGTASGMGGGGVGGSGLGLFEIIIIGGLLFFLYKKFIKPSARSKLSRASIYPVSEQSSATIESGAWGSSSSLDSVSEEINTIRMSDPDFDPDKFKEFAQDVFFKVQAAWMRRDITVMQQFLGQELLIEYKKHIYDLKKNKEINRLENIAVRKVEIVDTGMIDGEEFVVIEFTANLLDYTVDELSGKVIKGDSQEPVKFNEKWAFARPDGSFEWKLEGVQN